MKLADERAAYLERQFLDDLGLKASSRAGDLIRPGRNRLNVVSAFGIGRNRPLETCHATAYGDRGARDNRSGRVEHASLEGQGLCVRRGGAAGAEQNGRPEPAC